MPLEGGPAAFGSSENALEKAVLLSRRFHFPHSVLHPPATLCLTPASLFEERLSLYVLHEPNAIIHHL